MIRSKVTFLSLFLIFFSFLANGQTIKGYTKAEIEEYTTKVEDQVRFLEYLLNTVGSAETAARDKDVVIRESYLKIFRDEQVQVEDDLLLDRKVVTNKAVTAYLKDIEFFYKNIIFKFKIREIKPVQKDDGNIFFMVSIDRTIEAIGNDQEKISNTKPRFIEVNLDSKSQDLKIVSMYTTKLSRDEELLEWWEILDPAWKRYFTERFQVINSDSVSSDTIAINELYKFVEIDSLDISGLALLDLSPLEALRNLKYVNISNTQITQLGPISNVTFLEHLDVSNTPTSDIQFIKYSDRLKHLDISNTKIEDISELVNLKTVRSLKADNTPIMNFSVLNEFDSLISLSLVESGFNNAENIKDLIKLQDLNLSRNYLINFSSLDQLTSLRVLNLSETNIQDLSPLGSLNNLEVVDLTLTPVSDISVFDDKPSLIKVLTDETKLSVVDADNFIRSNPKVLLIHHVKDLESWWTGLPEPWKESLRKANPEIVGDQPNVEILTTTIGLEELDLTGEGVETLNPITRFVKIKKINFSDNPVEDLLPLSEVKTLVEIIGHNSGVNDISPLKDNAALELIDLDGSPISSIMDVLALPNLKKLNVNGSQIIVEEVPEILIQKPGLTIVYRIEELNAWWANLDQEWQDIFRNENSLPENPDSDQLHKLTEVQSLEFDKLPVGNIEALTAFINLRSLAIFDAPLSDLSPLRELKNLKKLRISQVPVVDFSAVSALSELEELDISNSGIENLESLSGLSNLKVLNISGTNLTNLKGIESLINLEELDVASTNLRTLKPIIGLNNLKKLSCFNTRLTSRSVDQFKASNPSCEVRFY